MSRKGSFFGGGSGSRRGSLLGGLGRKGSVKGSVKEQEAEWGAKHAEGDYSRHCRLHDAGLAHHNKRMSFMADDTETFAEVARRATSELPPSPPKTNTAALDRARNSTARRASQSAHTDIWGNPRK